jgi:hypothetical protein
LCRAVLPDRRHQHRRVAVQRALLREQIRPGRHVETASKGLSDTFNAEIAIKAIGKALNDRWSALHDDETDTEPSITLQPSIR